MKRAFPRLVCLLHVVAILLMASTGLLPMLMAGGVHGYTLLAHGLGAALYVFSLFLVAVTFISREEESVCARGIFILLLWAGIVTSGTMLLAMTKLFDTTGQILLIDIHRWSSICAAILGLVYCTPRIIPSRNATATKGVESCAGS